MKFKVLFVIFITAALGLFTQLKLRPWVYSQDFPKYIDTIVGFLPSLCAAIGLPLLVILIFKRFRKSNSAYLGMGLGLLAREIFASDNTRKGFGSTFDYWDVGATIFGVVLAWYLGTKWFKETSDKTIPEV